VALANITVCVGIFSDKIDTGGFQNRAYFWYNLLVIQKNKIGPTSSDRNWRDMQYMARSQNGYYFKSRPRRNPAVEHQLLAVWSKTSSTISLRHGVAEVWTDNGLLLKSHFHLTESISRSLYRLLKSKSAVFIIGFTGQNGLHVTCLLTTYIS
jgi:hypothetical protein